MPGFERITRCLELTDADIEKAASSRAETKELIRQLSSIAKPNDGAPKVLLLFARLAQGNSDWLDGYLHLEVTGDDQSSAIEVMTDLGGGMRERLLPTVSLKVPLAEFARALERVPHMIQPLFVHSIGATRLVLSAVPPAPESQRFDQPVPVISTPAGSPSAPAAPLQPAPLPPVPDFAPPVVPSWPPPFPPDLVPPVAKTAPPRPGAVDKAAPKPPPLPPKATEAAPTKPLVRATPGAEEVPTKPVPIVSEMTPAAPASPTTKRAQEAATKPMARPSLDALRVAANPHLADTKPGGPRPPIVPPRPSQKGPPLPAGGEKGPSSDARTAEAVWVKSDPKLAALARPSPTGRHASGSGPFSAPTVPRMTVVTADRPPPSQRPGAEAPSRGEGANSRPTAPPPFDLTEFARKRTGPAPNVRLPEMPATMRPPTLDPGLGMGVYQSQPGLLTEDALLERIGPLERVPRVAASPGEIRALARDHATAFLLSQIDGVSTLEMIVDVSGMPRLDALRILFALIERRTIEVD